MAQFYPAHVLGLDGLGNNISFVCGTSFCTRAVHINSCSSQNMIATNSESRLGIGHISICLLVSLSSPSKRLVLQGSNFQGLMIVTQGWF